MAALTVVPSIRQDHDPTKDKSYARARSARAATDWLAWLQLGGLAARTAGAARYSREVDLTAASVQGEYPYLRDALAALERAVEEAAK